jgi:hypothetical protein
MIIAGLAAVCVSPMCLAKDLPARPADEQSAQGRVPAAASKAQPESKPQGTGGQSAPVQAEPVAATTEQVETKPPQVTYQDGELTIVAENATLSEVLGAVRSAMGANIDLPTGAADQRIWIRLGPGPARTVLRDLLDGTEYNYVIQASESDSDGIRSVLLTMRSKNPESGNTGTQVARGQNRNGQAGNASPVEVPDPETAVATVPVLTPPAPAAATADSATGSPEMPPTPPAVQSTASNLPFTPGSAGPGTSGPGGGSSEQMMQQLQSMYEQRRQMQMQQNQGQKPQAIN